MPDFSNLVFHGPRFDRKAAAKALDEAGCILIKNVIDRRFLAKAREPLLKVFLKEDFHFRNLWVGEEDYDNPKFWIVRAVYVSRIFRLMLEYFQTDEIVSPLPHSVYRWQHAGNRLKHLPFHQDEYAGVPGQAQLICWVLLDPRECNRTASGLELVPYATDRLFPLESPGASGIHGLEVARGIRDSVVSRGQVWRPIIELGDAIVFGGRTLHRTSFDDSMTQTRLSGELRFWPRNETVSQYLSEANLPGWFELGEKRFTAPVAPAGEFTAVDEIRWRMDEVRIARHSMPALFDLFRRRRAASSS